MYCIPGLGKTRLVGNICEKSEKLELDRFHRKIVVFVFIAISIATNGSKIEIARAMDNLPQKDL